jgi:predicted CXXCH cytochrome family protein
MWQIPAMAAFEFGREPDTAKKCAICHFRWVSTFFIEHRSTPFAQVEEKKDVVGSPEMCLSCHDGSIRDSRDRVCNDPGHRVGIKPSDKVSIPGNFPLDENGLLQCSTCHTPHAVPARGGKMVITFLRGDNANSSLCRECHKQTLGGTEQGNHPVNVQAKTNIDAIAAAGGKFGDEGPSQIICQTCHMAHGGVTSKRLVLSVENTQTMSILCEVCHTKKPVKPGAVYAGRYSHPLDVKPGRGAKIPAQWSSGDKVVTGERGELVCRTCHKPHFAADNKHLLVDHTGKDGLCIQCHTAQGAIADSTHDLRVSAPREKNVKGLAAADAGPCDSCHVVHSATAPFIWARTIPAAAGADRYCTGCHAAGQCAEKSLARDFSHPVNKTVAAAANTAQFPLFNDAGERSAQGGIACMTCHDAHNPAPVYSSDKPGLHGNYLRLGSQGPVAHCAGCHAREAVVQATVHDLSIGAPGYRNALRKTPAQTNLCGSCHAAHGAPQKQYMWAGPKAMAVPSQWLKSGGTENNMIVSLCTGCHQKGGVAEKHVPRFGLHPDSFYSKAAERSADIARLHVPIYNDAGKRTAGGAIVCATCHNPHQWDGQKMAKGPGTRDEGTIATSFLRPDLSQSVCAICHGSDALFKYLYFHNRPARDKKPEPFPFGNLQ